jgi:hypothetical protein
MCAAEGMMFRVSNYGKCFWVSTLGGGTLVASITRDGSVGNFLPPLFLLPSLYQHTPSFLLPSTKGRQHNPPSSLCSLATCLHLVLHFCKSLARSGYVGYCLSSKFVACVGFALFALWTFSNPQTTTPGSHSSLLPSPTLFPHPHP